MGGVGEENLARSDCPKLAAPTGNSTLSKHGKHNLAAIVPILVKCTCGQKKSYSPRKKNMTELSARGPVEQIRDICRRKKQACCTGMKNKEVVCCPQKGHHTSLFFETQYKILFGFVSCWLGSGWYLMSRV